tara:strand:- start:167 stop:802 length:636 start_codon:yes stop_codon:yes gene_type:complete
MMSDNVAGAPVEMTTAEDAAKAAQAAEAEKQAAILEALRSAEQQSAKEEAQAARRAAEQARQERERAIAEASKEAVTPQTRAVMTEAAELRAQAEAERERLESLANEYDTRLRRERERDRLSTLRGMGALGSLTDEQLLAITPDVDPHSPGGKAQLDEWRERNSGLFLVKEGPTIPTPSEMLEKLTVRSSASGLYDEKFLAKMLRDNLGGN